MVGHDLAPDRIVLVCVREGALQVTLKRVECLLAEGREVVAVRRGDEERHVAHVLDGEADGELTGHRRRDEAAGVVVAALDRAFVDGGPHRAVCRECAAVRVERLPADSLMPLHPECA